MSWDLILRHCGAIGAQIELLRVQVMALEDYAKQQHAVAQQPKATIVVPYTCKDYKDEECARLCEEAVIEMGGMGGSAVQVMCRGCTLDPTKPVS